MRVSIVRIGGACGRDCGQPVLHFVDRSGSYGRTKSADALQVLHLCDGANVVDCQRGRRELAAGVTIHLQIDKRRRDSRQFTRAGNLGRTYRPGG